MTRAGGLALAAGLALVAAGLALVWPALVVLGGGCLLVLAAGTAWVLRPQGLRADRQLHPDRVPKGTPAIVFVEMANRGRGRLPETVALQPCGDQLVRMVLPALQRGERGVRAYRLPTARRGVYAVGPMEVVHSDPFGLLRVRRHFGRPGQLWVTPAILPLDPLPSGVTRHLEGPSSDTAPAGDITFHRLREYQMGDDLRMVHWPSTARTGRLMVRHNIDTSQPYTVVLLDLDPARYSADTFETAVDMAASVVVSNATGGAAVQLCTSTGERVGGPGARSVLPVVDRLTEIGPDADGELRHELLRLRHHRGGTALVVVTGALDPDLLPAVGALRRRFNRLVVVAVGPASGARFPGVQVVEASDAPALAAAWHLAAGRRSSAATAPAVAGIARR